VVEKISMENEALRGSNEVVPVVRELENIRVEVCESGLESFA
jgi:hypothetical protein